MGNQQETQDVSIYSAYALYVSAKVLAYWTLTRCNPRSPSLGPNAGAPVWALLPGPKAFAIIPLRLIKPLMGWTLAPSAGALGTSDSALAIACRLRAALSSLPVSWELGPMRFFFTKLT
jgi:hypothetical protein